MGYLDDFTSKHLADLGDVNIALASDSKKFGYWNHNPMAEWHAQYRGPGKTIYWHVECKAVCIYLQLKIAPRPHMPKGSGFTPQPISLLIEGDFVGQVEGAGAIPEVEEYLAKAVMTDEMAERKPRGGVRF